MHPRPLFVLESTHRAALGLLALGVCALAGCALPDPVLPPEPEKVTTLRPDAGIDAGEPGDGGACVPVACTGLCGSLDDGCGHTVECGGCPTGELCGGGGAPNRCGAGPCTPSSCGQGACGQVPDGCGNTLECGGCLAPTTCGGGGTPSRCGCTPETDAAFCQRLGKSCGYAQGTDNCGQPRSASSCGTCPAGQSCGGAGAPNQCGVCTPSTCASLGKNCGFVSDGCGGQLKCGICPSMFACSKPANPPPNVCLACKAPDTSCHTSSDCCSNICGSDHFCHRAEWGGQCSNDNDCDRDPSTPVFNFTCHDNLCCKVAGLPCGLNSECCHGCNLGTHQCN